MLGQIPDAEFRLGGALRVDCGRGQTRGCDREKDPEPHRTVVPIARCLDRALRADAWQHSNSSGSDCKNHSAGLEIGSGRPDCVRVDMTEKSVQPAAERRTRLARVNTCTRVRHHARWSAVGQSRCDGEGAGDSPVHQPPTRASDLPGDLSGTIKTPEPTMAPTTTTTESSKPNPRGKLPVSALLGRWRSGLVFGHWQSVWQEEFWFDDCILYP